MRYANNGWPRYGKRSEEGGAPSQRAAVNFDSALPLDVPERRLTVEHAGDVLAIRRRRDRLAERDIGHVFERLQLDLRCDLLLLVEVRCAKPRAAQFFDLGTGRPAEARILAVAAQPRSARPG